MGRGLGWVTPRGPFQPLPCWVSVKEHLLIVEQADADAHASTSFRSSPGTCRPSVCPVPYPGLAVARDAGDLRRSLEDERRGSLPSQPLYLSKLSPHCEAKLCIFLLLRWSGVICTDSRAVFRALPYVLPETGRVNYWCAE